MSAEVFRSGCTTQSAVNWNRGCADGSKYCRVDWMLERTAFTWQERCLVELGGVFADGMMVLSGTLPLMKGWCKQSYGQVRQTRALARWNGSDGMTVQQSTWSILADLIHKQPICIQLISPSQKVQMGSVCTACNKQVVKFCALISKSCTAIANLFRINQLIAHTAPDC